MGNHTVHVVAAVIYDASKQKVLISKRPENKHQGGKWEFPGGKVETAESAEIALQRELREELGIGFTDCQRLIQIHHDYTDKSVFLDVFEVIADNAEHEKTGVGGGAESGVGEAEGKEGQAIRWVEKDQLSSYNFPDANRPVLRALSLPEICLVTPNPSNSKDPSKFLNSVDHILDKGISLILFRAKELDADTYLSLANQVIERAHRQQARVILNSPPEMLDSADGLHLTSPQLNALDKRPELAHHQMLSASCHSEEELNHAMQLNVDFAFLSPVKQTSSHPELSGIGWDHFQQLTSKANCPVYALGGMTEHDISDARKNGGQGIAAITGLWII